MAVVRWLRLVFSFCFFCACLFFSIHYRTSVYLLGQARGQLSILSTTKSFAEFKRNNTLSAREAANIKLIQKIKDYSVDSLGYAATDNFTRIYDQKQMPVLWVITACEPYAFREYQWVFPIVGRVSYKGFFKKELAQKEANHLAAQGYDVDLRSVSAWSTLGWFSDPILSSMLNRSAAGLCNLLFHELFHATYYAPSSVNLNENLANFIADKATLQFLKADTAELSRYRRNNADELVFNNYMLRKKSDLEAYYKTLTDKPDKLDLKLKALVQIADSVGRLPLSNAAKYKRRAEEIRIFKNAYFVDFQQYESMQDSLENVFNKIYKGNIENLVRGLRLNKINY